MLNQLYERDTDALMRRTRLRPLPAGRVAPADARIFGLALSAAGLALLAARANWLSAALALATLLTYLVIYTPMKRRTPLSTLVGAVPGALPALIGWTASHGSIDRSGAALFAIVFCWQMPHFMAIAWLYRDDYAQGRLPDAAGDRSRRPARRQAGGLLGVPAGAREPGADVQRPRRQRSISRSRSCSASRCSRSPCGSPPTRNEATARALFYGSITYLPLLWIVDDRQQTVTVHDLPAVNASLNALSGVLLLVRLHADAAAADRRCTAR